MSSPSSSFWACTRASASSPNAAYSDPAGSPNPTPRMRRLPETWSRVTVSRASFQGRRAGLRVVAELGGDLGPGFRPAIRAGHRAQGHERVHMGGRPMHTRALEPGLDHQLVAAFHDPAADGVDSRVELRVA